MTIAMQLFRLRGGAAAALEEPLGKTPPFVGLTPGRPVQVFPLGIPRTVDGRKVRCETADLGAVLTDLATRRDPVRLTVEHGEDPRWGSKAAGECSRLGLRADGLWADDPAWTADALEEIRSGARRGISPTFYGIADDEGFIRPRVLRDISLVSVPNLDGMALVEAGAYHGGATRLERMRASIADAVAVTADPDERRRRALFAVRGIGVGLPPAELAQLGQETALLAGSTFSLAVVALTEVSR